MRLTLLSIKYMLNRIPALDPEGVAQDVPTSLSRSEDNPRYDTHGAHQMNAKEDR